MIDLFIKIRILDLIDIFLVAFLMYQIYMIIRGTIAINIFMGIFALYLLWLLVKAFNMHLLSSILGQIIGVGVIALIIVFQQEVRRFLLVMGSRYLKNKNFSIENIFYSKSKHEQQDVFNEIIETCFNMAKEKSGALIVLTRRSDLSSYVETGEELNAKISPSLVESIFLKQSSLHDGALIVEGKTIIAARCVLPITEKRKMHSSIGMRHRAALGMSENTDAIVLIVSEERGYVSIAIGGELERNVSRKRLLEFLQEHYLSYI
ncbi:diadenylate cyclase CdaA [Bacteroidota bacterium]